MKTFAAALLMATVEAGWKHGGVVSTSGAIDGAVIVGPGGTAPIQTLSVDVDGDGSGDRILVGPGAVNPSIFVGGAINQALAGGAIGSGATGPFLAGGVAGAGLHTGVGGGGRVFIDSGVDNNAVDAARFAGAIQGSNLLAGNTAGYLAG